MVSQIGLSKTNIVKPKFHHNYTAKHQKTSRVPINLQPRATHELNRLQKECQIEKLTRCSDKKIDSPIMITVKKDLSKELALVFSVLT